MTSTSKTINDFKQLPGTLDSTKKWYSFPTIISKSRLGKENSWTIMVAVESSKTDRLVIIKDSFINNEKMDDDLFAVIRVNSGYTDGKIKDAPDTYIREGKNIGKVNETNVFCQALRDAYSKYIKQKDKSGSNNEYVRPMLASNIKDIKNITWPMYIQCKFDGNRAMTKVAPDRTILFYSRNLKPIKGVSQQIDTDIVKLYSAAGQYFIDHGLQKSERECLFFDGELYKHGASLQQLGKLRKKSNDGNDDTDLKYYIYDLFLGRDHLMKYEDRLETLRDIAKIYVDKCGDKTSIVFVDTYLVENYKGAEHYYKEFLRTGYEGAILRVPDAVYTQSANGYHSKVLIKMKPRHDAEFEVVGIAGGESKGKEEGALMVVCVTDDGQEFTVQPALPLSQRIELFNRYSNDHKEFKRELEGKYIKVYYDDESDDKVPLRAKTKLETRND